MHFYSSRKLPAWGVGDDCTQPSRSLVEATADTKIVSETTTRAAVPNVSRKRLTIQFPVNVILAGETGLRRSIYASKLYKLF